MSCFTFVRRKILSKMYVPFYLWGLKSYKYMSWNYCQAYILLKLWIFCPYTHPLVPYSKLSIETVYQMFFFENEMIFAKFYYFLIFYIYFDVYASYTLITYYYIIIFQRCICYISKQFQSHLLFICFMHHTRLGCFYVTAILTWGWGLVEVEVEVEVEVDVEIRLKLSLKLRLSWG